MSLLKELLSELITFFRINGLIEIIQSGNFRVLLSFEGFLALLSPITPFIVFFEFVFLHRHFLFEISFLLSFSLFILILWRFQ
jgi:hypothetical protein